MNTSARLWSALCCWISGPPAAATLPVLFPTQGIEPDYLPLLPQQARIAATLDCALPCARCASLPPLPAALPISQRSGARSHPRALARRVGR